MEGLHEKFNDSLERLIDRFGYRQAGRLLQRLIDNKDNDLNRFERQKLLMDFMVLESVKVFNVTLDGFFSGSEQEDKDARMACIHLLKQNTGFTYKRIGLHLKSTKRSLMYFKLKCDDFLAAPSFYKGFCLKYEALEKRMIGFMLKTE